MSVTENRLRKVIHEVLSEVPNRGAFEHTFSITGKPDKIYHTTFSSGLGSIAMKGEYRATFKQAVPDWVAALHPYHQFALCRRSIAAAIPLPRNWPEAD